MAMPLVEGMNIGSKRAKHLKSRNIGIFRGDDASESVSEKMQND